MALTWVLSAALMRNETPPSAGGGPAPEAREPEPASGANRRRVGRLGVAMALVAGSVVAVGGAVAWAVGGDDDTTTGRARGEEHDHAQTTEPAAGGDDPSGEPTPGGGRRHVHPSRPSYEARYAAAGTETQEAADALLAGVRATLADYADVDAAVAAGFQPPRNPRGSIEHYLDPAVAREGHVLDPARPNGLVFYTGGGGDPVLLGAFFIAPPATPAPMPAGDLVVWHSHNPSCPDFFATASEPCSDVRRMLHVWTVDQVEMAAPRTGQPLQVRVTDPFGAPFRASVARAD
jgi:hypothetical protein